MQYKIIVDKQPSSNPSDEKKEYIIDIEELRVKGDVYDGLNIEMDRTYVTRRLSLSEYGVLSVLDEPVIENLDEVNIELFEGDNYIYLSDMQGNNFYAEYLIKNDFNNIYATKNEMNSAITQTAQSIELSVNQKLTSYATTEDLEEQVTELNSTITQTASEINAEVEKKVDEETITGAYLILKINGDTSEAKLNADKIELSANDILNLLAENTINLSSKEITLKSDHLKIEPNGAITITDEKNSAVTYFTIKNENLDSELKLGSWLIELGNVVIDTGQVSVNDGANFAYIGAYNIQIADSTNVTTIQSSGITTPKLTQTSLETIKKNITKFTENATEIINNADIYEYNLNSDADTDKKMIGFVIGDKYKTPDEVIDKEGQAVSLYSAIGILWKAVQELSVRVEQLEKEVHK